MISSPAVAAMAVAAFSTSAMLILGGYFWVFDRAWMAALADRRRADDRLLQAKHAWQGMWLGLLAVIVLVLALIFVVPSVHDSSLFAWVLGGSQGAWIWGLVLIALAVAFAAAEVVMNVRILRSLSQNLPDPMPNSLSRRWRWIGVALFGLIAILVMVSVLVMAWILSFD